MNKAEFVLAVAKRANASRIAAEVVVGAALDVLADAIASGETVRFVGFGTFSVGERKARSGRNPQTGKELRIPARKVVRFKPGSALAAATNKGMRRK